MGMEAAVKSHITHNRAGIHEQLSVFFVNPPDRQRSKRKELGCKRCLIIVRTDLVYISPFSAVGGSQEIERTPCFMSRAPIPSQ